MQTSYLPHARRALLLVLCTGLMALAAPAVGKEKTEKPAKVAKPRKPSTKIKFEKDSSETTAERDRRLMRECHGRPNAGACLGYTR